jgi:alginate biosynthesis protein AlgX
MYLQHILHFGIVCLSLMGMAASPALSKQVLYKCPYLKNDAMQTTSEMRQGYNGWFFRIGDLEQHFALTKEPLHFMERLNEALNKRGSSLVFLSVPSRGMVGRHYLTQNEPEFERFEYERALKSYEERLQQLRERGILAPNMITLTSDPSKMPDSNPYFFKRDHHWRPEGSRHAARTLATALENEEKFKNIKKADYTTFVESDDEMEAEMALESQRLCLSDIPSEPFKRYRTQLDLGKGSDALFGEISESDPVVLIGSSYSAMPEFNFDGFLMEHTGLEIANRAISAGQLFNAITSYTSSPQFHEENPPFIIWEAPSVYDLNVDSFFAFRQIVPAVHGPCSGPNKLAETELKLDGKGTYNLLDIDAAKKVSGNNYYFFIQSSNKGFAKFTLLLDYDDGDGEWFPIDRTQHFENSGWYFVELDEDIESNLVKANLESLSDMNTSLKVSLCRVPEPAQMANQPTPTQEG